MWSQNKLRKLKRHYPNMDNAEIAKMLNMSVRMVERKAEELGLAKDDQPSFHWTAYEEIWLHDNYGSCSDEEIALMLNKTVVDVQEKVQELGLRRESGWSNPQLDILERFYSFSPNAQLAGMTDKNKMRVEHMAFRMGLRKSSTFYADCIDTEEEIAYVKEVNEQYNKNMGCSRGHYVLGRILDLLYPSFTKTEEEPIGSLRIDWYIPDLRVAFEYDGIQHYEYSEFFHGSRAEFRRGQERDYQKSIMCEEEDIAIVRFAYDEPLTVSRVRKKVEEVI